MVPIQVVDAWRTFESIDDFQQLGGDEVRRKKFALRYRFLEWLGQGCVRGSGMKHQKPSGLGEPGELNRSVFDHHVQCGLRGPIRIPAAQPIIIDAANSRAKDGDDARVLPLNHFFEVFDPKHWRDRISLHDLL